MKNAFAKGMFLIALLVYAAGCGGSSPVPAGDVLTTMTPADGATGVPVNQVLTATFSKDLNEATLTAANITLMRSNGAVNVPGAIAYDAASRTLTFTPTAMLMPGAAHTFTIGAAAQTKAAGDVAVTFTTMIPPMIFGSSTNPSTAPLNILSMNADGSNQTQLTTFTDKAAGSFSWVVAWSPDYSRIAFTVITGIDPNTTIDLYVMNADGSGLTKLTNGVGDQEIWSIKWAPDGSRIYFFYKTGGVDAYDLGSVNPDGSGLANLTNMTGGNSLVPCPFQLSPDGTKIIYSAGNMSDPSIVPYDVYIMNSDGSGITRLTSSPSGGGAIYPLFSRDMQKIYYTTGSNSTGASLNSMNMDGSAQQTLVAAAPDQMVIPWGISPDGTQLAAMIVAGGTPDVYLVNASTGALTRLTTASGTNKGWVGPWAFSPDGSKVAYIFGDSTNGPLDLFVANPDGSGQVNVTNYTGDTMVFAFGMLLEMGLNILQWSPDGTQIAFTQMVKSTNFVNIEIAKPDGSSISALTNYAPPQVAAFFTWW